MSVVPGAAFLVETQDGAQSVSYDRSPHRNLAKRLAVTVRNRSPHRVFGTIPLRGPAQQDTDGLRAFPRARQCVYLLVCL